MPWTPSNLATKGALASFHQAMEGGETVFDKHCAIYPSGTKTERYSFPGAMPVPRQWLDGRQFQGARDFTFTLADNTYELSMITDREAWEDDQTGLISQRYGEAGEVWKSFKDVLFAERLTTGNVSGSNGFDGTTFHSSSHASGTTGLVVDNDLTENWADTGVGTAAEFLTSVNYVRSQFLSYTDDMGRYGYNKVAVNNLRYIVPPGHARGAFEAMNQVAYTGGSGATGEFGRFLSGVDVMPELAGATGYSAAEIFISALGSVRKPFIYQERTPLEVIIKAGAEDVALNNGVMLLTRQRFVIGYGDFRRNALDTIT